MTRLEHPATFRWTGQRTGEMQMEPLPAGTLLGLLKTYESALAELRATGDIAVDDLIARLKRHRAEVIAALDARHRP